MAKVLIQEGIKKHLERENNSLMSGTKLNTDNFRDSLERQSIKRLKGAPRRIRYLKKSDNN